MPLELHHTFAVPTAWHILLRTLIYTAATLLGGFGGLRGYRGYRGGRFAKQDACAQTLRDEIVFAEDFDQLHLGDEVETLKKVDTARPSLK